MLVDGDAVIYESAIINEYLEEKYPAPSLMPADLARKAKARIWIDFCNSRLQAAAHEVRRSPDPEAVKQKLRAHLETLNREIAGRTYIADEFSLADITFIPFYTRQQRYGIAVDDSLPNLKRWMENLIERPAVQSTL